MHSQFQSVIVYSGLAIINHHIKEISSSHSCTCNNQLVDYEMLS